jgi:hypothetical protein
MEFRSEGGGERGEITAALTAATSVALAATSVLLLGCAPSIAPLPAPVAVPRAPVPAPAKAVARTALPTRLDATTWRITSSARLKASGGGVTGDEQRVDSRALVSWTLSRTPSGAIRGTGQVDSFTVRSSLDSAGVTKRPVSATSATTPLMPPMVLVEATLDSAMARVTMRPPLANECDRPEATAASLAREVLLRVPDGLVAGDRWRDSTVSLVCRSGVPMAVYSTIWSTLESISDERLVITRQLTTRLDGKGGSAFRALELTGTGAGTQRIEMRASDGSVSKLEGSSTLTLQLRETTPPSPPRVSQVVQRVEVKGERVSR